MVGGIQEMKEEWKALGPASRSRVAMKWKGNRNRQQLKKGNTEWAGSGRKRDMMEVTMDSLCIGYQLLFLISLVLRGWRGINGWGWQE